MLDQEIQKIVDDLGLRRNDEPPSFEGFLTTKSLQDFEPLAGFYSPHIDRAFTFAFILYSFKYDQFTGYETFETRESTDYYFYGHLKLKRDWGQALMRPEKIEDKFINLFSNKDIKFKQNKKFCSRFYITSSAEGKLRQSVTPEFMKALENEKDLLLEFSGDRLIFRLEGTANPVKALRTLEIGERLTKIIA